MLRLRRVCGCPSWRIRLPLLLALAGLLTLAACSGDRSLTPDQVDARAQEYFLRGIDHYQRAEFRPALESFRIAKVYDLNGSITSINEYIEKAENQVKVAGGPGASKPSINAVRQPTPAAPPKTDGGLKTHRSRLFPYSVDLPENWSQDPGGAKLAGALADLFNAPRAGSAQATLTVVAYRLPADVDRRAFVEAYIKRLRAQRVQTQEIGERPVDGAETAILRAAITDERGEVVSTYALFATEKVGWDVTFTTSADESDRLQPLFHRVLDSFHVSGETSV